MNIVLFLLINNLQSSIVKLNDYNYIKIEQQKWIITHYKSNNAAVDYNLEVQLRLLNDGKIRIIGMNDSFTVQGKKAISKISDKITLINKQEELSLILLNEEENRVAFRQEKEATIYRMFKVEAHSPEFISNNTDFHSIANGELSLIEGRLNLYISFNKKVINLRDIEINEAGYFNIALNSDNPPISGILQKMGDDQYSVRILTGELIYHYFVFSSKDEETSLNINVIDQYSRL